MFANFLRSFLRMIFSRIYKVKSQGIENIPKDGGVLLLPNHISYIDGVVLQLACPRVIRFLIYEDIYEVRWLNWFFQLIRFIPVNPKRSRDALDAATKALKEGDVVCIFPEGELSRTAALHKLHRGYEVIAKRAGVPIIPVWHENLWGSIFSFTQGKFFWKMPEQLPYPVSVYFGQSRKVADTPPDTLRALLLEMGAEAFNNRDELKSHIAYEAMKSLKSRAFRTILVDAYAKKSFSGGKLLGVSLLLAGWIKKNIPEKRVGLVLPPGLGGSIGNLACALADKVPVNLNFTAGRSSNESAIKRAELKSIITAEALEKRIKDFPWTDKKYDLPTILQSFGGPALLGSIAMAILTPSFILRRMHGVPAEGGDREIGLLFTSGSSGEPKGVVLSHRNIIANTAQCAAVFSRVNLKNILGCLPIFHSFGCTVTFWWPLLGGPKVITFPSPLEIGKLVEVIQEHNIELMITTPTFLRGYLKRAKPEQLQCLRFVITGAEKLPAGLREAFQKRFDIPVCEGYGMTEAAPVVSANLTDHPPTPTCPEGVVASRPGSVGRPLPGIAIKIRDPETDEDISIFSTGMLWLKGANIFGGYLNDPEGSQSVLQERWYKTGDLGCVDEDGFLHIEGRLSRFSKIAGEMAPHGTIEARIMEYIEANGLDAEEEMATGQPVMVTGVPDEAKGEAIVVLSAVKLDANDMRKHLLEAGLPSLWIPKRIIPVDAVPILASGKLDLKRCQEAAQENEPEKALTAA